MSAPIGMPQLRVFASHAFSLLLFVITPHHDLGRITYQMPRLLLQ